MPALRAPVVLNSPIPTPVATGAFVQYTVRALVIAVLPATVTPVKYSPVMGVKNGVMGGLNFGSYRSKITGTLEPCTTFGIFRLKLCNSMDIGGVPNHNTWTTYTSPRALSVSIPPTVTPVKYSPVMGAVNGYMGGMNFGHARLQLIGRMATPGTPSLLVLPASLNVSIMM